MQSIGSWAHDHLSLYKFEPCSGLDFGQAEEFEGGKFLGGNGHADIIANPAFSRHQFSFCRICALQYSVIFTEYDNAMAEQLSLVENSRPLAPHNRLGLDYRQAPPHRVAVPGGIIDAHNHCRDVEHTRMMVEAGGAYGVTEFWTMAPLEFAADTAGRRFRGKFHFVAVPGWKRDMPAPEEEFFADWKRRLEEFAKLGSKLIKFHAAPGTCRRWGISLDDPRILDVAETCVWAGVSFYDARGGSEGVVLWQGGVCRRNVWDV